jgi:hypothetical protein
MRHPIQNAMRLIGRMFRNVRGKSDDIANPEDTCAPCFQIVRTPELAMLIRFNADGWQPEMISKTNRAAAVNDLR